MIREDITIELARVERHAQASIEKRIASTQLGEVWKGLENGNDLYCHVVDCSLPITATES